MILSLGSSMSVNIAIALLPKILINSSLIGIVSQPDALTLGRSKAVCNFAASAFRFCMTILARPSISVVLLVVSISGPQFHGVLRRARSGLGPMIGRLRI